ncbi:MAG: TVP38/TMEM64 family protein [Burkholderiales bacterium]
MNSAPTPIQPSGSKWVKLAILAVFIGGIAAFFVFGGQKYLNLDSIKQNRDLLLNYTRDHYALALVGAFLIYTASTALSLPGGIVLSLMCGFLFGRWGGTGLIVCAATLGAALVFLAARYLFADAARKRLGSFGEKINQGFTENGFNYLLFLRLVPLFPFWLVNLAPAFTNMKLPTYVAGTALGIIPGSFVFANLGQSLGSLNSLGDLLSNDVKIAFALLGLFALVPVLIKKLRAKKA